MRYKEIVAYTGYGKICHYICVGSEFNDRYAKDHHWDTVPFPTATKIRIITGNGNFERELPIAGYDDPLFGDPAFLRQAFKNNKNFPTSSNWFQIFNILNDLVKESGDHDIRYVTNMQFVDGCETLEFILESD